MQVFKGRNDRGRTLWWKNPEKEECSFITVCLGVRCKPEGEKRDVRTRQEADREKFLLLGNFLKFIGHRNVFLKRKRKKNSKQERFWLWIIIGRYLLTALVSLCLVLSLKIQCPHLNSCETCFEIYDLSTLLPFPVNNWMSHLLSVIRMTTPLAYSPVLMR